MRSRETHPLACPLCGSWIQWGLPSGMPGSLGTAACGRSPRASRVNRTASGFCPWEGRVVRGTDGAVAVHSTDEVATSRNLANWLAAGGKP